MGIYLKLFHGRKDPSDNLEDWGENGPLIGPFSWFHGTYLTTFTFGDKDEGEQWYLQDSIVGDLIYYDGMFYGDFTIATIEPGEKGCPVPLEPEKAVLPPEHRTGKLGQSGGGRKTYKLVGGSLDGVEVELEDLIPNAVRAFPVAWYSEPGILEETRFRPSPTEEYQHTREGILTFVRSRN